MEKNRQNVLSKRVDVLKCFAFKLKHSSLERFAGDHCSGFTMIRSLRNLFGLFKIALTLFKTRVWEDLSKFGNFRKISNVPFSDLLSQNVPS